MLSNLLGSQTAVQVMYSPLFKRSAKKKQAVPEVVLSPEQLAEQERQQAEKNAALLEKEGNSYEGLKEKVAAGEHVAEVTTSYALAELELIKEGEISYRNSRSRGRKSIKKIVKAEGPGAHIPPEPEDPYVKDRDILLKITGLKKYFPVKGSRNLFVKANDGLNLSIKRGETFGLVGESGCGKSTFGRVLLQLHKQTEGKTLYYGRRIDDMAPEYYRDTVKHLPRLKRQAEKHRQEYKDFDAKYKQMDEKEQFKHHAEWLSLRRKAQNSYLDIVTIIGGFFMLSDFSKVTPLFLKRNDIALKRAMVREQMAKLDLKMRDTSYSIRANGNVPEEDDAYKRLQHAMDQLAEKRNNLHAQLLDVRAQIEALKEQYKDDPEFERHEQKADDGIDLARLKYNEIRYLRSDLQLIFQDPYSSLNPRMTVGQIIAEGLAAHNLYSGSEESTQEYVMETMEKCGLDTYMIHRYPHQFSGGQRQRIGIARSLAVDPRFVVCDEAVSALDVSIQSQIINLLQDLGKQSDLTYLFISHDLSVVKYISDRIGVMYLGVMVELAETQAMFDHPRHPYTEALLSAIPTTDASRQRETIILEGDIPSPIRPPKGCKFHTRCRYATERCCNIEPELKEEAPGHWVACHYPLQMVDGKLVPPQAQIEAKAAEMAAKQVVKTTEANVKAVSVSV